MLVVDVVVEVEVEAEVVVVVEVEVVLDGEGDSFDPLSAPTCSRFCQIKHN